MIGDPVSIMYYKGEHYYNNTIVVLSDTYIKNHTFYDKKIWKYARFDHIATYNNQRCYVFCKCNDTWFDLYQMGYNATDKLREVMHDCAPYFYIPCHDLNVAIEKIADPIKVEKQKADAVMSAIVQNVMHPKSDFDTSGMIVLWIIYIVVMIGSLIFQQFYLLWIVATILFIKFRKDLRGG